MPTPPTRNTEAKIRRAIRAAIEAGVSVGSVEVAPDGTIRLLLDGAEPTQPKQREPEEW